MSSRPHHRRVVGLRGLERRPFALRLLVLVLRLLCPIARCLHDCEHLGQVGTAGRPRVRVQVVVVVVVDNAGRR